METRKSHSASCCFWVFVFVCLAPVYVADKKTSICHIPTCDTGQLGNQSYIHTSCQDLTVQGRCCLNKTTKDIYVKGVDLSSCNLTTLHDVFSLHTDIEIVVLDDNPVKNCGTNFFIGLSNLSYLSLPKHCGCPGDGEYTWGNSAWASSHVDKNSIICKGQIDICKFDNVTCPNKQSFCTQNGPGETLCLCKPGYFGYKCMRNGQFPWLYWSVGLGGSTFVLTAFLWVTQRKNVRAIKND